jgi:hypothetical protein
MTIQKSGFHSFHDEETGEPYGSFEVFFHPGAEKLDRGWYWWPCFPGCLADSDHPCGPFESSKEAYKDANQ